MGNYRHNPQWYYVENAIHEEGELTAFRAWVDFADSRQEAEAAAAAEARRAHPRATDVEFYMSRKIASENRAKKIQEKFGDGTWEGWFERHAYV